MCGQVQHLFIWNQPLHNSHNQFLTLQSQWTRADQSLKSWPCNERQKKIIEKLTVKRYILCSQVPLKHGELVSDLYFAAQQHINIPNTSKKKVHHHIIISFRSDLIVPVSLQIHRGIQQSQHKTAGGICRHCWTILSIVANKINQSSYTSS